MKAMFVSDKNGIFAIMTGFDYDSICKRAFEKWGKEIVLCQCVDLPSEKNQVFCRDEKFEL